MPITLPTSPTIGQTFLTPTGTLVWDGTAWKSGSVLPTSPVYKVTVGTLSARPTTNNSAGDVYIVAGDPTAANNNKSFVWSSSLSEWLDISSPSNSAYDADLVNLTGDTMTGQLSLGKDPVDPLDAVPKSWLGTQSKPAYGNTGYGGSVIQTTTYREHVWTTANSGDLFIVDGTINNATVCMLGGGGGGGGYGGGGGGSGGLIYMTNVTMSGNYYVTVGAGGIGGGVNSAFANTGDPGSNGGDTVVGSWKAIGGGGGGGYYGPSAGIAYPGTAGGAGGGGGPGFGGGAAGASTFGQGSNAGAGGNFGGGGGGGAGGMGNGSGGNPNNGGGGGSTTLLGRLLGGGGGGGAFSGYAAGGNNGGNGGAGSSTTTGGAAVANTGAGGGGGGTNGAGGAGSGGIIIIRYPTI